MINTPERYDHHEDGMEIAKDGDFVSYDDYAALLARAEQAEARVAELKSVIQAFADFDKMPASHKRFDVFESRVRQPLLRAALSREEPKP
jgi:hypothetical protein